MSYEWISGRRIRRPSRGFRLRKRRFSVLRVRLFYFIRFFCKWKFPYEQALKLLKKGRTKRSIASSNNININENSCREILVLDLEGRRRSTSRSACNLGSYISNGSNSFYSEAISDCLEFIKMSALSADANSVAPGPN
jgi:hypothetical protein